MFIIILALLAIEAVSPGGADKLTQMFDPALFWIQRWMPVFYVPSLVVLPLAIEEISGVSKTRHCIYSQT